MIMVLDEDKVLKVSQAEEGLGDVCITFDLLWVLQEMFAGGVAFKEVAKDPSSGLIFWKQQSLLLLLNRFLHDFWFPIELQEESRNDADVDDEATANQEKDDVDGSDLMILVWDPTHPQVELVLGFEASCIDFVEDHA